jgi:hypothetical protein
MILNPIITIIGFAFAPLAALCAYIAIFSEYVHHYPNAKMPKKLALEAAIGTFVLFLAISVVIGWFLGNITR